jgi:PPOX class probable F420-dependent enzyme
MRLPAELARRLLVAAPVVRLATADAEGRPHIVPMTFAVSGDTIYSAVDEKPKSSHDLRRLRNIRANPRVAVLADHYADDWAELWWVRADGHAEIVEGDAAAAGLVRLLAAKYAQYRERRPRGPIIAVTVERWSGWAHSPPAPAPADSDFR